MTRIAVIEDDVDTSSIMRDVLRDSGHEVVSYFKPSDDILEHVKTYRPDLVILDARLNSALSGWDIIEALKNDPSTSSTRLAVVSGAANEIEAHREMLEHYGVPVLHKPFDIAELDALVDRLVGSATADR